MILCCALFNAILVIAACLKSNNECPTQRILNLSIRLNMHQCIWCKYKIRNASLIDHKLYCFLSTCSSTGAIIETTKNCNRAILNKRLQFCTKAFWSTRMKNRLWIISSITSDIKKDVLACLCIQQAGFTLAIQLSIFYAKISWRDVFKDTTKERGIVVLFDEHQAWFEPRPPDHKACAQPLRYNDCFTSSSS